MKQLCITGGIGSGKSTVCRIFKQLGVPVYNADERAKALYTESEVVKHAVIDLIGSDAYANNKLNREFLANQIFNNKEMLEQLNAIIHPAVRQDYELWVRQQQSDYVIKEAAILIESGAYRSCDFIAVVNAPKELRIQRVTQRDEVDRAAVEARISHQLSDEERTKYADFIIVNDGKHSLIHQILKVHNKMIA